MRLLYLVGVSYLAVCAALMALRPTPGRDPRPTAFAQQPNPQALACATPAAGSAEAKSWYCSIKPYCNPVEAGTRLAASRPLAGWDGAGYGAACYALAGRIDDARRLLDAVPGPERARAAAIVFEIGHPVADSGDDKAAGPIMALVLRYWPENYQAIYHQGMSEYALGNEGEAKQLLERFLGMYHQPDGFSQNARRVLDRIAQRLPNEGGSPGAHP